MDFRAGEISEVCKTEQTRITAEGLKELNDVHGGVEMLDIQKWTENTIIHADRTLSPVTANIQLASLRVESGIHEPGTINQTRDLQPPHQPTIKNSILGFASSLIGVTSPRGQKDDLDDMEDRNVNGSTTIMESRAMNVAASSTLRKISAPPGLQPAIDEGKITKDAEYLGTSYNDIVIEKAGPSSQVIGLGDLLGDSGDIYNEAIDPGVHQATTIVIHEATSELSYPASAISAPPISKRPMNQLSVMKPTTNSQAPHIVHGNQNAQRGTVTEGATSPNTMSRSRGVGDTIRCDSTLEVASTQISTIPASRDIQLPITSTNFPATNKGLSIPKIAYDRGNALENTTTTGETSYSTLPIVCDVGDIIGCDSSVGVAAKQISTIPGNRDIQSTFTTTNGPGPVVRVISPSFEHDITGWNATKPARIHETTQDRFGAPDTIRHPGLVTVSQGFPDRVDVICEETSTIQSFTALSPKYGVHNNPTENTPITDKKPSPEHDIHGQGATEPITELTQGAQYVLVPRTQSQDVMTTAEALDDTRNITGNQRKVATTEMSHLTSVAMNMPTVRSTEIGGGQGFPPGTRVVSVNYPDVITPTDNMKNPERELPNELWPAAQVTRSNTMINSVHVYTDTENDRPKYEIQSSVGAATNDGIPATTTPNHTSAAIRPTLPSLQLDVDAPNVRAGIVRPVITRISAGSFSPTPDFALHTFPNTTENSAIIENPTTAKHYANRDVSATVTASEMSPPPQPGLDEGRMEPTSEITTIQSIQITDSDLSYPVMIGMFS